MGSFRCRVASIFGSAPRNDAKHALRFPNFPRCAAFAGSQASRRREARRRDAPRSDILPPPPEDEKEPVKRWRGKSYL